VSEGTTVVTPEVELLDELAEVSRRFETAPPGRILEWVIDRFGHSLSLAASFQDIVLVDLAVRVDPRIEIVFLDTDAHFPETLEFVEATRQRYDLNLVTLRPGPEAAAYPCGGDRCCEFRKVAPLRGLLSQRAAWITALKRVDASTRADAPIVSFDQTFGLVKVNPLATWSEDDIASYLKDHDLPFHPLHDRGYVSIGCAPTTRPVALGEDPRAGRWSNSGKTECGLHV
jgi:phosphoadenosine phosphosulfate reductase